MEYVTMCEQFSQTFAFFLDIARYRYKFSTSRSWFYTRCLLYYIFVLRVQSIS